jgi:hypothetical protein
LQPSSVPNGKQFVSTAGDDVRIAAINGKNRVQLTKDCGPEADGARG